MIIIAFKKMLMIWILSNTLVMVDTDKFKFLETKDKGTDSLSSW